MDTQTHLEERWNAISHAFGAILGIAGLVLLLVFDQEKTHFSVLSIILYSISIIVLFSASTIYHSVKVERWKRFWRKMDHISIYLLIAGTYTPIALITMEGGSGWTIFYTVWGIALAGTFLKVFFTGKYEAISLLLYLAMGWLIIFYISELLASMSVLGLTLLAVGGGLYTLGTIFYAVKKIPYNHVIWHFFVLGGAVAHYLMVLLAVV